MQIGKLDIKKYSALNGLEFLSMFQTILAEEEESQIASVSWIIDFRGTNVKHIPCSSDLKNVALSSKHAPLLRQKQMFLLNMPKFTYAVFEVVKLLMSEKLKNRLYILKNVDELKHHFASEPLLIEFGGKTSESEMIQSFKSLKEEKIKKILSTAVNFDDHTHPTKKVFKCRHHGNGESFKALNVD